MTDSAADAEVQRLAASIPVPRVRSLAERITHAQALVHEAQTPPNPSRSTPSSPQAPFGEADRLIALYERAQPKRR